MEALSLEIPRAIGGAEMTTLVTGATGFVGGNLARALVERDEEVRVLVRQTSNDLAIRDIKTTRMIGDLLAPESLREAVDGCDTVYHCAANYSFWSRQRDDIYQTNVRGTQNLLRGRTFRRACVKSCSPVRSPPSACHIPAAQTPTGPWVARKCRPSLRTSSAATSSRNTRQNNSLSLRE